MAKKIKFRGERNNAKIAYLFILPWLIGLLIFTLIPIIMTVIYSFNNVKQTNFGFEMQFVGFTHYTNAFLGNLDFSEALLDFLLIIEEFLAQLVGFLVLLAKFSFIVAIIKDKKPGKGIFKYIEDYLNTFTNFVDKNLYSVTATKQPEQPTQVQNTMVDPIK